MRQQQREHTRELILEAAVQVFARQGFEGASMADIAALAGVKKALVQYHFTTKDNLWREAVDHLWALRDRVLPGYIDGLSQAEGLASLRQVFLAIVRFNRQHPEWLALVFRESAAPGERLSWLIDRHLRRDIRQGCEFIETLQSSGLLPGEPPLQVLHLVSGALSYSPLVAAMTAEATGQDLAVDAALEEQVDILLRMLGPASH